MATQTQKKTIKRKQGSTAQKTKTKWNLLVAAIGSPVIGAEASTESMKKKLLRSGLKVSSDSPYKLQMLGEKVLMEEEPIELTPDIKSNITQGVCDLIESGKIILPDDGKFMISKFPYRGTVLSVGSRCREVKVGDRIHFAPMGVHRFEFEGKQYLISHERDVHGIYAPFS